MKLKLKFTVDQIVSMSLLLNEICKVNFNSLTQFEKLGISICMVLSDTFETKRRDLQKKNDLFNSRKKVTLTLKYHEAWALKEMFINRISLLENDYQKINIQNAINLLDAAK